MTEILDEMNMPFVDLSFIFPFYFPVLSLARQKKIIICIEYLDNMITNGELAKKRFYK